MAINSTAVWRLRTGGSSVNGGGFDPSISGAGTDYSQQDAAQLSLSDIACSNTTTVTSTTGGFTSAMIGNAIRITGGGATSGNYFITGRTNTNTITVDSSPGTVTNGTGNVGGAQRQTTDSYYNTVVPGNIVYIRASAGNASSYPTTSLDYTMTWFQPPNGSTSGLIRWIGENGMPTIGFTNALGFFNTVNHYYENLYCVATSNDFVLGMIVVQNGVVKSCIMNANSKGTPVLQLQNSVVINTEIYGGSNSPSYLSGADGIVVGSYGCSAIGCKIHHMKGNGITGSWASIITDNLIYNNAGDGITYGTTNIIGVIINNTIDNNLGNGISTLASGAEFSLQIINNIISNHTGGGKYGINCYTANSQNISIAWGYNNLYNNTANYFNTTASSTDLSVNPNYTGSPDFTPANAALKVAYPTGF